MKKFLIIALILIVGISITAYIMIPKVIYGMVTDFDPWTFEKVLGDTTWINDYQIGDYREPQDFGYDNTEEIEFTSINDGVKLSAWYVPCKKPTDSTIFMIHGRTSNRLKTMKYLELFQKTGIDTLYNFFIADFRNSGKSETGMKTYMGYKFAEDLAGGMKYLKEERGQNEIVLYGFSMGAMSIYTYIGRDELGASNYDIDRIIIDSPLSNVVGNLRLRGDEMSLPSFLVDRAIGFLNDDINGYVENLSMSAQLADSDIPLLLIQSNHDTSTPASFTKEELKKLSKPNITSWFVDSAAHVKVYTHPDYKEEYSKRVSEFLR